MLVCCECCLLSGRGLCDGLITRPEESYQLWCVVVCDLETAWKRRPWPTGGCFVRKRRFHYILWRTFWYKFIYLFIVVLGANAGHGIPIHEVSRSYSDLPHSVGLLWTSDQFVAETSPWQHTALRALKQRSMHTAGFEPTISAGERPQHHASDRTPLGPAVHSHYHV